MATIDITVVQGALPVSDDTLVLRVTLDDGTVRDLEGVKLQGVQEGVVAFSSASSGSASALSLVSGDAAFTAVSQLTAEALVSSYVDAEANFAASSTLTAAGLTTSNVEIEVIRGGLKYGEAYTLRVTFDGGAASDLTGVELEPAEGEAAVDVVDPVTTEDSIFYQVVSGTPATGQQIWHDDSPNTTVLPSGRFEQVVLRNFNAQVWDTDYTWGQVTLIKPQLQLAVGGLWVTPQISTGSISQSHGLVTDSLVMQPTVSGNSVVYDHQLQAVGVIMEPSVVQASLAQTHSLQSSDINVTSMISGVSLLQGVQQPMDVASLVVESKVSTTSLVQTHWLQGNSVVLQPTTSSPQLEVRHQLQVQSLRVEPKLSTLSVDQATQLQVNPLVMTPAYRVSIAIIPGESAVLGPIKSLDILTVSLTIINSGKFQ